MLEEINAAKSSLHIVPISSIYACFRVSLLMLLINGIANLAAFDLPSMVSRSSTYLILE